MFDDLVVLGGQNLKCFGDFGGVSCFSAVRIVWIVVFDPTSTILGGW